MSHRILIAVVLAWAALLYAGDKQEVKLADRFMKLNRQAGDSFSDLNAYCQTKHEFAGIRNDTRVWGCVIPQPLPPPGTNR